MKRFGGAHYFCGVVNVLLRRIRHRGWRAAWTFLLTRIWRKYIALNNRLAWGNRSECPCCGWRGYDFIPLDVMTFWIPRVLCPQCDCQERHRMLHAFLMSHDPGFPGAAGKTLHFAPERHVRDLIERHTNLVCFNTDYSLDALHGKPSPKLQSDIQRLPFASDTFEVIFCLHVLEHVRDDIRGIRELFRVLKPGGTAYIMVPFDMAAAKTFGWDEPNPDVYYHVWAYSMNDFKERLAQFAFDEIRPASFLSIKEQKRFAIAPKEVLYRCTKPVEREKPV